jgi:hypothetical protein
MPPSVNQSNVKHYHHTDVSPAVVEVLDRLED